MYVSTLLQESESPREPVATPISFLFLVKLEVKHPHAFTHLMQKYQQQTLELLVSYIVDKNMEEQKQLSRLIFDCRTTL